MTFSDPCSCPWQETARVPRRPRRLTMTMPSSQGKLDETWKPDQIDEARQQYLRAPFNLEEFQVR